MKHGIISLVAQTHRPHATGVLVIHMFARSHYVTRNMVYGVL